MGEDPRFYAAGSSTASECSDVRTDADVVLAADVHRVLEVADQVLALRLALRREEGHEVDAEDDLRFLQIGDFVKWSMKPEGTLPATSRIAARLAQQYPAEDAGWGAQVVALREETVGEVRRPLLILLGAVAYTVWLERKLIGRMQNSWGPTRVGPFGLLQPIADGLKFIVK